MTVLQVIPGHAWPLDAVTQKFAWLGRTGSGKSYACKRFAEQMLAAGAQIVVVDSVGVWFGLRQGERGFDIPVIGGLYGDIPLEPTAGALVAEVAVSSGSSLVLDVSQMNDAERARFMTGFGQRLFELKKVSPGAMHLVLDEGQDAVPQNPLPHENMMLHEWVRICKQGRAFGMGVSIVSQRPQEISKKALNQVECVLAFQLTGAHERKALEYWLSDKGIDTKLARTLPTLEVGVPYVWSPQWLKIAEVTERVLPIRSADTSQTPRVGEEPRARQAMLPIDLRALQQSMATMVEKVKETDPTWLKKRVQKLEAELLQAASGGLDAQATQRLANAARAYAKVTSDEIHRAIGIVMDVEEHLRQLHVVLDVCKPDDRVALELEAFWAGAKGTLAAPPSPVRPKRAQKQSSPPRSEAPASALTAAEMAILLGAYQYGDRGVTRVTLGLMTDYRTSYVDQCVKSLVSKGLVLRVGPGRIQIAASGVALVPAGTKPYPRGKKLIDHLITQVLPEAEGNLLAAVVASKAPVVRPRELGLKYAPSYIDQCVKSLVSRRVLTRSGAGQVRVHPEVFA